MSSDLLCPGMCMSVICLVEQATCSGVPRNPLPWSIFSYKFFCFTYLRSISDWSDCCETSFLSEQVLFTLFKNDYPNVILREHILFRRFCFFITLNSNFWFLGEHSFVIIWFHCACSLSSVDLPWCMRFVATHAQTYSSLFFSNKTKKTSEFFFYYISSHGHN